MLMAKILLKSDEKLMVIAEQLAEECSALMELSDRCDDAFKFEKCMHDGVKERKLEVGLF